MAAAVNQPRWELQVWESAAKTATGQDSTAKGKETRLLLRAPVDAPIVHSSIMGTFAVEPWLRTFVTTGTFPPFGSSCGRSAQTHVHVPVHQHAFGRMARDATVKLVRTHDGVVLKEWAAPLANTRHLAAGGPSLCVCGNAVTVKKTQFDSAGIAMSTDFLEDDAIVPILQQLRVEHRTAQLAEAGARVEQKKAALKRAREELEEAEEVQKKLRADEPERV